MRVCHSSAGCSPRKMGSQLVDMQWTCASAQESTYTTYTRCTRPLFFERLSGAVVRRFSFFSKHAYTRNGNPGATSPQTKACSAPSQQPHRKHRQSASDRHMVSVQGQSLYGGSRGFVRVESEEEQPPLREVQGSGVKLVSTLPPSRIDPSDDAQTASGIAWRFRKAQVGSRCFVI